MASVRERHSKTRGTTWSVLFRHGNKQASRTFETAKAADDFKKLVDLLGPDRALEVAFGSQERDDRMTVDQLWKQFIGWKRDKVTPRTLADYERDYRNWVRPEFGHRAAASVDERDVQRWVDRMGRELAPKSVGDRHLLLFMAYKWGKARSRNYVQFNPCEETELPVPKKKRAKGTTVSEWRAILEVADRRNPDARDLIQFLGDVGWRFSEAIALPVRNVEERDDGVWVNMTQVFRMENNRQVLTPDASKSFAGFRQVPVLADETAAMLLRRCAGKGPNDFVFTNTRGNHWNQQTFLRDTWPGLLTEAGLWHGPRQSPTPHWLRHMAVAVLAASGAHAHEIMPYVGHEDVSTTLGTYGGMLGGLQGTVREKAARILAGEVQRGMVVTGEVIRNVLE